MKKLATAIALSALFAAPFLVNAADENTDKPVSAPKADAVDPAAAPKDSKMEAPVLFIGDSMMKILGKVMEKSFKDYGVMPAVSFSSLGSGLVRPSVFNWTVKAEELCATNLPKTVFIALGTNDRQKLECYGGGIAQVGTTEWDSEYVRRMEELLDKLFECGVTHAVWLLLPPMQTDENNQHAAHVNKMVKELALSEKYNGKLFTYDMGGVLTRRPGVFTATVISKTGAALHVRENDGVHLTREGSKRIAEDVLKKYWGPKKK